MPLNGAAILVCLECEWMGTEPELAAQSCPLCDGRVAEEGSREYGARLSAVVATHRLDRLLSALEAS